MTALLYALGIVFMLAVVGLSIGLHELGHLVPAKRFGLKVTHFMIGFGPTLFSFKRGETRYGIKLLPLGGFIAMPGMYPPKQAVHARAEELRGVESAHDIVEADAQRRAVEGVCGQQGAGRKRLFEQSAEDAREFSNRGIAPGEEGRTFYALSVPKRLTVMFGGPAVNLVLGIVFLGIVLMGIGVPGLSTQLSGVVECAVDAETAQKRGPDAECQPGDTPAPAKAAGLKPGDTITAVDGTRVDTWEQVQKIIADSAGRTVTVAYERGGGEHTVQVPIIETERAVYDDNGKQKFTADGKPETATVGFLGVSPQKKHYPLSPAQFPAEAGKALGQTFTALATLPVKLVQIGNVALGGAERDPNGPMGMVGVGRVAGEIVSADAFAVVDKVQLGLSLAASLNLFLFAFNMVPLLPLDGGHIAVALYEGARRRINLSRGRGLIGPFDTAKLLPLTYGVVGILLCMTALLVYVDIVKPVRLFG